MFSKHFMPINQRILDPPPGEKDDNKRGLRKLLEVISSTPLPLGYGKAEPLLTSKQPGFQKTFSMP
jgi:hypothetical protein